MADNTPDFSALKSILAPVKSVIFSVPMQFLLAVIWMPIVFFPDISTKVTLVTFGVLFSRSTSLMDNLKVEYHNLLLCSAAFTLGFWPAFFAAWMSAPLQNRLGRVIGSFQKPPWIFMDCVSMMSVSLVASLVSRDQLFWASLAAVVFISNGIIAMIRINFLNDDPMRRFMLSSVNIVVNYIFFLNFLPRMIALIISI